MTRIARAFAAVAAAASAALALPACDHPVAVLGCRATECGARATCVAGRCQADVAGASAAIDAPGVKRVVIPASELAFVRQGSDATTLPAVIHLGRSADGDSVLLARFPYPYASLGRVVEAYLLLPRPERVTDDAGFFSLHAARIVAPWSARSTTWASRPTLEEVGTARTRLRTEDAALVRIARLDAKNIVDRFRDHDPGGSRGLSIAVVADDHTVSGLSLATPASDDASSLPAGALPALELYVAPE